MLVLTAIILWAATGNNNEQEYDEVEAVEQGKPSCKIAKPYGANTFFMPGFYTS